MPAAVHAPNQSLLPPAAAGALQRGATLLAPSQRAARSLRWAFDRQQKQSGRSLWATPPIFALETWLGSLWTQLLLNGREVRLLLNRSQEHRLWRSILTSDDEVTGLHSLDHLAALASRARQLLALYGGRARLASSAVSPDTLALARWAAEFDRRISLKRYLPAADLAAVLTAAVAEGALELPSGGVALIDFTHQLPAHASLFQAIERAGVEVEHVSSAVPAAHAHVHEAQDDSAELRAAVVWLAERQRAQPGARLALIVPDLAGRGIAVERALADVFPASSWESSPGQTLDRTAAAATALDLLRWSLGALPLEAVSRLLLSPFFGTAEPAWATAVAEFDAFELRRAHLLRPQLTLTQCLRRLEQSPRRERLRPLLERLIEAARHPLDGKAIQTHAAWAGDFYHRLQSFGWTAACDRTALSEDVRASCEGALDELATLDFENAQVTASAALESLSRIAADAVFVPAFRDAPVQVIGPREPGGVPFDALWFLGVDDTAWPPPVSTHPLLPRALQRAVQMPGADPAHDAGDAFRLTQSIQGAAAEVVFSYARHGEDQLRRPSPLLARLGLIPLQVTLPAPAPALELENFPDREAPDPLPQGISHGGARILELQAACGFRAFAELRLRAAEPESPEQGFDARESGDVLHLTMQHFWGKVLTQHALRQMSPEERSQQLLDSIEAALEPSVASARSDWDRTYLDVQRRRLLQLLQSWLEIELRRPDFSVRALEETVKNLEIGPLRVDLRVDRIDDTEGGPLILDYKSGKASAADWKGERPERPQLPLYAVLTEGEHLGGIAFAMLRAGNGMALEGVAAGTSVLTTSKELEASSMPEQIERWRDTLTLLAHEFAAGTARVDPANYPATCEFCAQRLLCRLDVSTLDIYDDEDEPDWSLG